MLALLLTPNEGSMLPKLPRWTARIPQQSCRKSVLVMVAAATPVTMNMGDSSYTNLWISSWETARASLFDHRLFEVVEGSLEKAWRMAHQFQNKLQCHTEPTHELLSPSSKSPARLSADLPKDHSLRSRKQNLVLYRLLHGIFLWCVLLGTPLLLAMTQPAIFGEVCR